jgi:hypothetical protein
MRDLGAVYPTDADYGEAPYVVGIKVLGEARYHRNALRFRTHGDAERYAVDLACRWTMVEDWEVCDTREEEN